MLQLVATLWRRTSHLLSLRLHQSCSSTLNWGSSWVQGVWFCLFFFWKDFPIGGRRATWMANVRRSSVRAGSGRMLWRKREYLSTAALLHSLRHAAFHLQHVRPAFKLVCVGAVLYVLQGRETQAAERKIKISQTSVLKAQTQEHLWRAKNIYSENIAVSSG